MPAASNELNELLWRKSGIQFHFRPEELKKNHKTSPNISFAVSGYDLKVIIESMQSNNSLETFKLSDHLQRQFRPFKMHY